MTYRTVAKSDVAYSVITEQILAALDKNEVPWRKPWNLPAGQRPHNAITKHSYTGINAIMLAFSGRTDPRWLTLRQVLARGGRVTRSEFRKATQIVFWKSFSREVEDKNTGETKTSRWGMYRYYRIYNVEQCEGLKLPAIEAENVGDFDPIAAADAIIKNMPKRPAITHDGNDGAYYVPAKDAVHMPKQEHFDSSGEYYSTLFHELAHSTGHASRLDRHGMETGIAPFGSETYSREELAAEFANAFVSAAAGIENTLENSAAYIAGWAKAIRKDIKLVVMAASQGQKAADYILAGPEAGVDKPHRVMRP
jgi:antirestriction protein ArdC